MRLARSTWPQVRDYFEHSDTVLIGVGSTECHGRHNPLGTDTMAPDRIMDLYEQRDDGTLIAPTLPYGATDDLLGFTGTISIGVQGLIDVMRKITDQLYGYGARRFVMVNGHGGNVKSLSTVCMDLNARGCLAMLFNWWKVAPQLNPEWGGGHGDGMETSANLAIDPDSVEMGSVLPEGMRDDMAAAGDGDPIFRSTGWTSVSFEGVEVDAPRRLIRMCSNGWVAEGHDVPPQEASAERGRAMLSGTTEYLVRLVTALKQTELPKPLDDKRELALADEYMKVQGGRQ